MALLQKVASRNAQINRTFGTQDRNVIGPQKDDVDGQLLYQGEKRSLLPAELQPSLVEKLDGKFAKSTFAGDTNFLDDRDYSCRANEVFC